jgi:hypothetical protein
VSEQISGSDKRIRSEDVDSRIVYLRDEIAAMREDLDDNPDDSDEAKPDESDDSDEANELRLLLDLRDELSGWDFTMIREDDFEDYAEDYAASIHGRAVADGDWPFNRIDWTEAADDLKIDYSTVEFDGYTYLYRAS